MSTQRRLATREEVASFLAELHRKMDLRDQLGRRPIVQFLWSRPSKDEKHPSNSDALDNLEWDTDCCIAAVRALRVEDYTTEGPIKGDPPSKDDLWVFGINAQPFKKKKKVVELYVKVRMGIPDGPVLCVSFHDAMKNPPLKYPFHDESTPQVIHKCLKTK